MSEKPTNKSGNILLPPFRISPDLDRYLDVIMSRHGLTRTAALNRIVREHMENDIKSQTP
jgi:hypothetical protein